MKHLEIHGREFPVSFTGAAWQALYNSFGVDVSELGARLDSEPTAQKIEDMNEIIKIAVASGRKSLELFGEDPGEDLPCEPKDVLELSEMLAAITQIFGVVTEDSKRTVEAIPPKN